MSTRPQGITHPSIDELLESTESKYSLVIYAARRARQITGYYSQMGDYLLEYVGPLVETQPQEKPMSIAMREIHAGLLVASVDEGGEAEADAEEVIEVVAEEAPAGEPELVAIDTAEIAEDD